MNDHLPYRIETQRTIIRCYHPNDADKFLSAILSGMDHLRPWMPWTKEPQNKEKIVQQLHQWQCFFDEKKDFFYGIFSKDEAHLIGSTGLHTRVGPQAREIGYWISSRFLRFGYATEAVTALTRVGFECEGLHRIEIRCQVDNYNSIKIPQRLGYSYSAILKNKSVDVEGRPKDLIVWSMKRKDYAKSNIALFPLKVFNKAGLPLCLKTSS